MGNLTFGPGGSAITVTTGGAAVAITAGNTWIRSPGSALDVALSGGTLTSSPALSATSNVVVGSGTGSGPTAFAVVSGAGTTGWATVSGGKVAALSSGGYANNTYIAGKNTNVTALNPSPAAFTADTLAFRTAQANTLTLSGTGLSTLDLGGLLVGAQVGGYATTITGGTLTSASNELVVQQYDASGSLALNSQIANNGGTPLLLTKAGPGQLILGNAGNSYSGGTVVGGGTLTLGAAGALGPATNPLSIAGGVLDLNGQAATVGGLSGSVGSITNNAAVPAAASLTVNLNSATSTYGGTIADGGLAGNTVALNVQGPGTLVLTGSNTYSGGTNITGGVLSVSQDANLGVATSPLYLNGGTLNVTTAGAGSAFASYTTPGFWPNHAISSDFPSTTRPISWGSGGATFNIANPANTFTLNQQLTSGSGDLVKTGPGTLWLSGTYSVTGSPIDYANDNGMLLYVGATYTGSTKVLGGTLMLDYSGNPGNYNSQGPYSQQIGTGPMVLGNATVGIYFNGSYGAYGFPGYETIIPSQTVSGLTLLPGDSLLQSGGTASGFDFSGGLVTGGSSTVTRQVGGCLNLQCSAKLPISPTNGSPGAVTAWLTTSTFIDASALTPLPAQQYWDTEFSGIGLYGSGSTVQPNIALWTTGQDVTNATALNVSGTDATATVTGSNAFSGSLPSNLAIDSLRILPAAASNINLGGNTLQISSGGILVAFNCVNATGNLTQISGGTLTAGNANYGGDLIIQQYNVGVAYPQYSSTGGALID